MAMSGKPSPIAFGSVAVLVPCSAASSVIQGAGWPENRPWKPSGPILILRRLLTA